MKEIMGVVHEHMGFSMRGFLVVILAMLPNILYGILPKNNVTVPQTTPSILMGQIENISRVLFIIFFVVIVNKKMDYNKPVYILGMVVFLLLYYYLWARYFMNGLDVSYLGKNFGFIPAPLAVFPVVYFAFAALWLHNIPAGVAIVVFGICHIVNSYYTLHH